MRKGLSIEYREEKLAKIRQEIESDDHYENTPTSYYGEFDPSNDTQTCINHCRSCGGVGESCYDFPKITQVPGAQNSGTSGKWLGRKYWYIACDDCDIKGRAAKQMWRAVLEWNKSPLSESPSYKTLPMFGLPNLPPKDALYRLIGIRRDLELKSKTVALQGDLPSTPSSGALGSETLSSETISSETLNSEICNSSTPTKTSVKELKAYLAWCIYALSLVKQYKEI